MAKIQLFLKLRIKLLIFDKYLCFSNNKNGDCSRVGKDGRRGNEGEKRRVDGVGESE